MRTSDFSDPTCLVVRYNNGTTTHKGGDMGREHLKPKQIQDLIDEELCGYRQVDYEQSTGWCSAIASLYDEEHTPDFPTPQGPNPIELIDRIQRTQVRDADKFDRTYEHWGVFPGKSLKF